MAIVLTALFLFACVFCLGCWLLSPLKPKPPATSYHLVCFLEDAPQSALKGQAYLWATPLACVVPELWRRYYQQQLGQPGIDYWQWRNFPESEHLDGAIAALLNLPVPSPEIKRILEALALPKSPPLTEGTVWQQTQQRLLFQAWHHQMIQLIGQESLAAIYQTCYNIPLAKVEQLISINRGQALYWWQVLGVSPSAPPDQVEKAYKRLIRSWHPDLNRAPHATQVASFINLAYQEYNHKPPSSQVNPELVLILRRLYSLFK